MKKICIFLLMLSFVATCTSGCGSGKPKPNLIQSKRRFENFSSLQQVEKPKNVIDLSEGPKLNYDADLGPRNLNFEIKIVDPY